MDRPPSASAGVGGMLPSRIAVLVLLVVAGAVVAAVVLSEGDGSPSPGAADQPASASERGITVSVARTAVSGASVDVELVVTPSDDDTIIAGVDPERTEIEGVAMSSAHVRQDGTMRLRFPAGAWPDSASRVDLEIGGVTVASESAGFETVEGSWVLPLQAPGDDEAEHAREVVALDPAVVDLAGEEIVVDTFLTPSATVIRHQAVEAPLVEVPAPTLAADGAVLEPRESEQRGLTVEHRFDPVGPDARLVLSFEDVVVAEALDAAWELRLDLGAVPVPPERLEQPVQRQEIQWEVSGGGGHPTVLDIELRRVRDDVRLWIFLDSADWRPGPAPPTASAADAGVQVVGAGSGTHEGQPASNIVVSLDGAETPERLVIGSAMAERTLPPAEVVLRP